MPNERYYLNVPYEEKDDAKRYGAKWDADTKKWYCEDMSKKPLFKKWLSHNTIPTRTYNDLSDEQKHFIDEVKKGKNVLVDACIGSGKTTTIQVLCNELSNKNILYLTYNTLLKIDARNKIKNSNVTVTNYHGFAYSMLRNVGISTGISDLIQTFIQILPPIPNYDLIVIDEYQDIELEIAKMLDYIKQKNPFIQIVAVGDMEQKIYDKTSLNVQSFIQQFLGIYTSIHFTKCFRISKGLGKRLGDIWNKTINGVNQNCKVSTMYSTDIVSFLAQQNPSDVLCLGARTGVMADTLNKLEKCYPNKYNKHNTYASIRNDDKNVTPNANNAIFTTFDSAKGLERKICCVFDYTEEYFLIRKSQPFTNPIILRNIFCVAASRGKEQIIFVLDIDKKTHQLKEHPLKDETLKAAADDGGKMEEEFFISTMFDFKYIEDVMECYNHLNIECINDEEDTIEIPKSDGLIDLSPCIGHYQEMSYFKNYNLDNEIELRNLQYSNRRPISAKGSLQRIILNMTAQETCLLRYITQVKVPFVNKEQTQLLHDRLNTIFTPDVDVQGSCSLKLSTHKHKDEDKNEVILTLLGIYDVFMNDIIYELKFVNELNKIHFLQLACYLVTYEKEYGILWNVYDNKKYKVSVKDIDAFLSSVVKCITKRFAIYDGIKSRDTSFNKMIEDCKNSKKDKKNDKQEYDFSNQFVKDEWELEIETPQQEDNTPGVKDLGWDVLDDKQSDDKQQSNDKQSTNTIIKYDKKFINNALTDIRVKKHRKKNNSLKNTKLKRIK